MLPVTSYLVRHNPQIQFNAGGPIIRLPSANTLAFLTDSSNERMRIDSSGTVKITGSNEQSMFHLSTGNTAGNTFAGVRGDNESGVRIVGGGSFPGGGIELAGGLRNSNPGIIRFYSGTAGSVTQRMTLNNSGDFFVAKTSDSSTAVGHSLNADGLARHVRSGGTVMAISRGSSDGTLVVFQRAGVQKEPFPSLAIRLLMEHFVVPTGDV